MDLLIVSGAPGAGKTTLANRLAGTVAGFVILDIDVLADAASDLAGRSIYTEPETWPAYGRLWFDVLQAVHRNGHVPVWFTPNSPDDLKGRFPAWCQEVAWLLLDCDDDCRIARLKLRTDWEMTRMEEALQDAAGLRSKIKDVIDTNGVTPDHVANELVRWIKMHESS